MNTRFLPLALLPFTPTLVRAQPASVVSEEIAAAKIDRSIQQGVANGPTDRSLYSAASPEIELLATEKDKRATLSWSFFSSASINNGRFSSDQFSLKLSTSFDGSADTKQLFGLKGFANGTDVGFSYIHFSGRAGDPASDTAQSADDAAAMERARKNCIARNLGAKPEDIAKKCDPDNADFVGSTSSFLEEYNPRDFDRIHSYYFPSRSIPFFGLAVTGNQTGYGYFDMAAFQLKKDSKFGYEATAFGGVLLTDSPTAFTGSMTVSRDYKAQDPITICQAVNASQTQCLTGANGAPKMEKATILSLEARHMFGLANEGNASFAIAPEFSYDLESKAYAISVPVYFFPGTDGSLRGGVRFGYTSEKEAGGKRDSDFALGLFFGVPFTLF